MSAVVVLAPLIVGNWAVIGSAVTGALTAMGFSALKDTGKALEEACAECEKEVSLDMEGTEAVTEGMALEEQLAFQKEGVTVVFYRDARGSCGVKVYGSNQSDEELRQLGEKVSQRIVQQYVYDKVKRELKDRNYHILEESEEEDETIKLRVRHWQG